MSLLYDFQEALGSLHIPSPEEALKAHYEAGRLSEAEYQGKLRVIEVDHIIDGIHAMMERPTWQPAEREPIKVIQERRIRENQLKSMATAITVSGGRVRKGVIDGN